MRPLLLASVRWNFVEEKVESAVVPTEQGVHHFHTSAAATWSCSHTRKIQFTRLQNTLLPLWGRLSADLWEKIQEIPLFGVFVPSVWWLHLEIALKASGMMNIFRWQQQTCREKSGFIQTNIRTQGPLVWRKYRVYKILCWSTRSLQTPLTGYWSRQLDMSGTQNGGSWRLSGWIQKCSRRLHSRIHEEPQADVHFHRVKSSQHVP